MRYFKIATLFIIMAVLFTGCPKKQVVQPEPEPEPEIPFEEVFDFEGELLEFQDQRGRKHDRRFRRQSTVIQDIDIFIMDAIQSFHGQSDK